MVLGRKTYEGLAAVWPQLADDPAMVRFAERLNPMPKYVASRTLTGPLEWNASLIRGDLDMAIPALKAEHRGNLIVSGCGELAHSLTRQGSVDSSGSGSIRSSGQKARGSSTAWGRFASSSSRRPRTGQASCGCGTVPRVSPSVGGFRERR
jgi:hypothetical protein